MFARILLRKCRALHSELLTKLSSWFSSRDEFSRVETSSEGSDITKIFPKFEFWLVPTLIFENFSQKLGSERVFASRDKFGRLGHYKNISKIWKKSISETRENENFGKKRLTQGLTEMKSSLISCWLYYPILTFICIYFDLVLQEIWPTGTSQL